MPSGEVRSIAILEIAAIGDTLLLAPLIRDLRNGFPAARLTLFAAANNFQAGKMLEGIDQLVKVDIKNPLNAIRSIRQNGPIDLLFDFGQWPRYNSLLSHFSGARFKLGYKTRGQYRHFTYDKVVEHSAKAHEFENYRSLVRASGIAAESAPVLLSSPKQVAGGHIVVHMFPGGTTPYLKEWPEENWIKIIDHLTSQGGKVVLTGVGVDKERAEAVRSGCRNQELVEVGAGRLSLVECSDLILGASLVISVNTGIMHLAAMLERNLIALNGPTSAKRWGPLNKNAIAIQAPIPCSPCLNLGFEYGCDQNLCMQSIGADKVLEAISTFKNRI